MLLPPFRGASAVRGTGITDHDGFIRVDGTMRVEGVEGMYAVGDCVNVPGPKLGHIAVLQGEVAAANLAAEIEGRDPEIKFDHEMTLVGDDGGRASSFLHKQFWYNRQASVRQGCFRGSAMLAH
jgi:sulfide:quinone oxidoreductase